MYSYVTQNGNDAQYLSHLLATSESDVSSLPTNISPGSTCFIEETGATFMLSNSHYWFKVISSGSGGGSGEDVSAFHLRGTIPSTDNLPVSGQEVGDVYVVGPLDDGSYEEWYWSMNRAWELMGKSLPDLSVFVSTEELYAGLNGAGTVEEPADGTILAQINEKIEESITDLHFGRIDDQGNEDNTLDYISIFSGDDKIGEFFSSSEKLLADVSFVADELVSYFTDLDIEPETYDGRPWNSSVMPIADMTAENGPYLVLITANAGDGDNFPQGHAHVKNMKTTLSNYATAAALDNLASTVESLEENDELEII